MTTIVLKVYIKCGYIERNLSMKSLKQSLKLLHKIPRNRFHYNNLTL